MERKMKKNIFFIIALILGETVYSQNQDSSQIQKTMTVADFCSLNLTGEINVKIEDELSPEKIHNLCIACNDEEKGKPGPVNLDLSSCTFKNGKGNLFITNLKNVRSLILPQTTEIITFCLCSDLENVVLPDGLKRIEEKAFFRTKLKFVEIPESVEYVGACAFGDIETLKYIQTFNNLNKASWCKIWNEWNDANVLEGEYFSPSSSDENLNKEKLGKIHFSQTNYQQAFDTIDMEIILDKAPKKKGEAVLHFYDAHNKNESSGDIKITLKKGQKTIELKYRASDFYSSETDLYYSIINNCGDYWIKLCCELELSDGTRIPLDGFCYIYEEPFPGSIS